MPMNKDIKQNLSELMDNELAPNSRDEILDHLISDEEAREHWARMHLVRDVVQSEFNPELLDAGFSSRVSAAILDEPEPVADSDDSNIVEADFGSPRKNRSWFRPVGGLAIAATVAAVSVLGLRYLQPVSEPGAEIAQSTPAVTTTVVASNLPESTQPLPIAPVSVDIQRVNNTGTYWTIDKQRVRNTELEKRLNSYLSDHIEFATMQNVGGMLPYSRLVGYDEVRP